MVKTLFPAFLLKDQADASVHLERVHFDNIERTKYDALVKEIRHVFGASTLRELVKMAYEAKLQMEKDGLFDKIIVMLDMCHRDSVSLPSSSSVNMTAAAKISASSQTISMLSDVGSIPVELSFLVKEPGRIRASLNSGVNNRGEGQAGGDVSARSVFGRGEILSGDASYSYKKASLFHFSFWKPLLGWRDTSVSWHLYRSYMEAPHSHYSALENGVAFLLSHQTFFNCTHNIRLSAEWRKLACVQRNTAWAVRQQAGHSLKCAVHNILKYSTVDSEILPRRGMLLKLAQEIAGFGGDVQHLRHDLEIKGAAPLPYGFFFSPGLQATYIQPRGGQNLCLIDRSFLGGPTDMRGFGYHGIGPKEEGACMGGMASYCAGLHLFRPLIPPKFFFAHIFGVAGNICPLSYSMTPGAALEVLNQSPRLSLGVGVAIKLLNFARLELNYVWPVNSQPTDVVQPGLQFGVGISFI